MSATSIKKSIFAKSVTSVFPKMLFNDRNNHLFKSVDSVHAIKISFAALKRNDRSNVSNTLMQENE